MFFSFVSPLPAASNLPILAVLVLVIYNSRSMTFFLISLSANAFFAGAADLLEASVAAARWRFLSR